MGIREMIFRGKRTDNGEWVYGFPFAYQARLVVEGIETWDGKRYRIDPSTVGQYTGLIDKNGKRIFEGDILSDPERPKYTTGAIYYGKCNCSCCDGVYGFYSKESADLRDAAWLTVIGNIHDNPELLEGKE